MNTDYAESKQEVLDSTARKEYINIKKKYEKLIRTTSNKRAIEELKAEFEKIREEFKKGIGLYGKSRIFNNRLDKEARKIHNALMSFRKKYRGRCPDFIGHCYHQVKRGSYQFRYTDTEKIEWFFN